MSTVLKKTVINDENGNPQIVYVNEENNSKQKMKDNLTIAYFGLGTLVLAMTAWMMYKKFKI